jgi:hypothetical protein
MPKYDARLACSTTREVLRRLAITAEVEGQSQSEIATTVLDKHLPTAGELADRIRNGENTSDLAS